MKKTIVYRNKDGKITAVCDGKINIDENLLSQKEVNLTSNQLNNLLTNGKFLNYVENEIKEIIPLDVQKLLEKEKEKNKIIENLNNATTIKGLKDEIINLINIIK